MGKYPSIRLMHPDRVIKSGKLFFDKRSSVLDWDHIAYSQLYDIYRILQGNYWIPKEIALKNDVNQWETLKKQNPIAARAYLRSIGVVKTMDSNQSEYVYAVSRVASDKAVANMMIAVANMEVIHNEAYTFVESSVTSKEEHLQNLHDTINDELLKKSNDLVFSVYEPFIDSLPEADPKELAKSLIGNAVLEGIRFVTAFAVFYSIHHYLKLMGGTVNQIQYINRDEAQHAYLFNTLYRILLTEMPELNTPEMHEFAHEFMKKAVENELEWAEYILEDVDFIDMVDFEDYVKYVANKRMVQMGYDPIYPGLEEESDNPFPWILAYEKPNMLRGDFFEETLLYTNSAVDGNVDDF
jgi:ribonucleoside-diphosphate reductase beta chain